MDPPSPTPTPPPQPSQPAPSSSSSKLLSLTSLTSRLPRPTPRNFLLLALTAGISTTFYQKSTAKSTLATHPKNKIIIDIDFETLSVTDKPRSSGVSIDKIKKLLSRGDNPNGLSSIDIADLLKVLQKASTDERVVGLNLNFGVPPSSGSVCSLCTAIDVGEALLSFRTFGRVHYDPLYNSPLNTTTTTITASNKKKKKVTPKYIISTSDTLNSSISGTSSHSTISTFLSLHADKMVIQPNGLLPPPFNWELTNFYIGDILSRFGVKPEIFKMGKFKSAPETFLPGSGSKESELMAVSLLSSIKSTLTARLIACNVKLNETILSEWGAFGVLSARNGVNGGICETGFEEAYDGVWAKALVDETGAGAEAGVVGLSEFEKNLKDKKDKKDKKEVTTTTDDDDDDDETTVILRVPLSTYMAELSNAKQAKDFATLKSRMYTQLSVLPVPPITSTSTDTSTNTNTIQVIRIDNSINRGYSSTSATGSISTGSRTVIAELKKAGNNPNVKGVIVKINSPGGCPIASESINHAIQLLKAKKPVVASLQDFAASGGYYIAVASDKIVTSPVTLTGSIGVFGGKLNIGQLVNDVGGRVKSYGTSMTATGDSPFNGYSNAEKGKIKVYMASIYDEFKSRVGEGRKMSAERVSELAQGRVWTGQQAVENGLADEVGGFNHAVHVLKVLVKERAGNGSSEDEELIVTYGSENEKSSLRCMIERMTGAGDGSHAAATAAAAKQNQNGMFTGSESDAGYQVCLNVLNDFIHGQLEVESVANEIQKTRGINGEASLVCDVRID